MTATRILIGLLLLVVLGVPFVVKPRGSGEEIPADAPVLVVVTPHVQQIRSEFGAAFDAWHRREHGSAVRVDFRTPGGTSEIRRLLEAQYQAAARRIIERLRESDPAALADEDLDVASLFETGSMDFDLMFGGGSYDHGTLRDGVTVTYEVDGATRRATIPLSEPAGFAQARLDEWFGTVNRIGSQRLYDPEQYWIGTALSSFGIVYNRDVLRELGLPEPASFDDMTDHRLHGWVGLADPRQSGSITTTMDSILGNSGWDEGWRILRSMCANTVYFTNSSTKPPMDVSQGDAAMGLAIDFYGRGQAQVVMRPGETAETSRVGYADPANVYVDADPISILRGCAHPELSRRFIEFTLSEEGQALWQFPARGDDEGLGPVRHELRRMPVLPVMYDKYLDRFVDRVNPFDLASDVANPGWRTGVQMMLGCLAIDSAEEQRAAWRAIGTASEEPGFDPTTLSEMKSMFFSWPRTRITRIRNLPGFDALPEPVIELIDGRGLLSAQELLAEAGRAGLSPDALEAVRAFASQEISLVFSEANYRAVRDEWRDAGDSERNRLAYTAFFRDRYAEIVRLGSAR
jgi:iron(III) transport system substrate-binding protein